MNYEFITPEAQSYRKNENALVLTHLPHPTVAPCKESINAHSFTIISPLPFYTLYLAVLHNLYSDQEKCQAGRTSPPRPALLYRWNFLRV